MEVPLGSILHGAEFLGGVQFVLWFILQLAVLLIAARLLGRLFAYLNQPPVVGELLAGFALGPSLLGYLVPSIYQGLFAPRGDAETHLLEGFSWISVVMLLTLTGMETDLYMIRRVGRAAIITASCGLLVPFTAGATLAYFLADMPVLNGTPERPLLFILLVAVLLSVSSVPVILRVLLELQLFRTNLGATILSAAIATDVLCSMLIAVASGLSAGATNPLAVGKTIAGAVLFLILIYFAGRPVISSLISWVRRLGFDRWTTGVSLAVPFGLAGVTQFVGLHAVFGAFVGGLLVKEPLQTEGRSMPRFLKDAVTGFFAPIFFATAGLRVNFLVPFDLHFLGAGLGIVLVAFASKLVGGTLGARLGGFPFWQAAAVGSGLNARGSMEVVFATLALSLGIITQQLYSVFVVMAVATTAVAPALLKWTLARSHEAQELPGSLETEATHESVDPPWKPRDTYS